jgi:hypothetical protein
VAVDFVEHRRTDAAAELRALRGGPARCASAASQPADGLSSAAHSGVAPAESPPSNSANVRSQPCSSPDGGVASWTGSTRHTPNASPKREYSAQSARFSSSVPVFPHPSFPMSHTPYQQPARGTHMSPSLPLLSFL